ncbi:protein ROOT HAIR DEFECTIVE 3 2-like [Pyrus ussuriensis x Pyrus communis]|uniref:Protein ROOT HAIR DEFECTIVE 3 2-like n=1 Tax=Pyrus ussuriensis x Pyrus communis TaxID=2448454 RepID=A0A5N5IBS6_9ROSA|nr:protein ROOT HAIR DEFECTIVE 3 2-like [Pyrus ussuriensis x Pyrus communis]
MLGHLRSKALKDFQVRLDQLVDKGEGFASSLRTCAQSSMLEFEKGCAGNTIMHMHHRFVAKLAELNSNYEKKLSSSLSGPVEALLETGAKDTWAWIRKLLNRETKVAVSEFSAAVANFELDNEMVVKMKQHLKDCARNVVETKAREEAGKIMIHMKDRFAAVFNYDSDSMPRVWTGNEDIRSITKDARTASLKLGPSLVDGTVTVSSSQNRKLGPSTDPLASSSWEECKSLWRQFKAETEYSVTQAISAQEPSLPHGSICCIFTFKGLIGTDGHFRTVPTCHLATMPASDDEEVGGEVGDAEAGGLGSRWRGRVQAWPIHMTKKKSISGRRRLGGRDPRSRLGLTRLLLQCKREKGREYMKKGERNGRDGGGYGHSEGDVGEEGEYEWVSNLSAGLQEQPISQLHNVGFVHSSHLLPVVQIGILETVLGNSLRAELGDHLTHSQSIPNFHKTAELKIEFWVFDYLEALNDARDDLVLEPGVFTLGVLSTMSTFSWRVGRLGRLKQFTSEAYRSSSFLSCTLSELTPPPTGVFSPPFKHTLFFQIDSITSGGTGFMSPWT